MVKRKNEAKWDSEHARWYIQCQSKGYRKSFYSSTPSKKGKVECEKKADAWLENALPNEQIKVSKLFDDYIKELIRFGRQTQQYESIGKTRIKPAIGNKRISDVTEQDLQDIIHQAHEDGLSKKSQRNIRGCCTAFIKYCRKRKCTTLIPIDIEIHNDAPTPDKKSLQPSEIKKIFESDKTLYRGRKITDRYINLYRFGISTGLRPSELIGLKWEDITDDTVTIRRGINVLNETTLGKNNNARRTFKLTNVSSEALKNQKELLLRERTKSEYVFCREDGLHATQDNVSKAWKRYAEYNGITPVSPYELSRHTFISLNKQMPSELLKGIVGHSDTMQTTDTYGHLIEGELDKAKEYCDKTFEKLLMS